MLLNCALISRRQFAGAVCSAGLADAPHMNAVRLQSSDWHALLTVLRGWLCEIAQFDDEDAEFLAVKGAVIEMERQLRLP